MPVRPAAGQSGSSKQPFSVAELFFELNNTDGDLGLHANVDGGGWTRLEIKGPGGQALLDVLATGSLRQQALTELSFESAEPTFTELSPDAMFRRFPEGAYLIAGQAQNGSEYESRVQLSHVLAAPVEAKVSGLKAAPSCSADPLPEVVPPVVIDWDPVTTSHPRLGKSGPVEISRYQLVVEKDATTLSLDLPPDVTELEIPSGITVKGGDFKFEIIARTTAGNNTAVESCFRVKTP
jgi:hypothetical protein